MNNQIFLENIRENNHNIFYDFFWNLKIEDQRVSQILPEGLREHGFSVLVMPKKPFDERLPVCVRCFWSLSKNLSLYLEYNAYISTLNRELCFFAERLGHIDSLVASFGLKECVFGNYDVIIKDVSFKCLRKWGDGNSFQQLFVLKIEEFNKLFWEIKKHLSKYSVEDIKRYCKDSTPLVTVVD